MAQIFASIILLRTGRWTKEDWAEELGIKPRTIYRLLQTMETCGIKVEVSREREHKGGTATPLFTIPADPIRKLLRL